MIPSMLDASSFWKWLGSPSRLLVATALLSLVVAATGPLLHEEAYYALYAYHLELSYFDHPPMVGWLIWLGISALGSSALGLRLLTVACGMLMAIAGVRWLRVLAHGARVRWDWVLLSIGIPFFAGAHFVATPDAPLCCFWALTVVALWQVRQRPSTGRWLVVGLWAGAALLSKYTAAFLGLGVVLVLLLDPKLRRQLATPGPWLGLVVALCCFSPVLLWNQAHDWASILYQTENRLPDEGVTLHWISQLLLSQFFGLSPLVFCGVIAAMGYWVWQWLRNGDIRGLWILAFSVPLIGTLVVFSLWIQVKINWLMPAYFTAVIGLLVMLRENRGNARLRRPVRVGRRIALVLAAGTLLLPVASLTPAAWNTWSGWGTVANRVEAWEEEIDSEDGVEGNVFFFSPDYTDAGQLEFHLRREASAETTGLESVHAENVFGKPAHALDYWQRPVSQHFGEDAIMVARNASPKRVERWVGQCKARFDSVEPVERVDVELWGVVVQSVDIFVCRNFRGQPGLTESQRR